ncbi:glucose-6-phosphate 1-dehydrogenase, partial [Musa troglodytarum]
SQKGCPENISSRGVCENITSGGREKEGVKISAVGWNLDRTRVEGGLAVPAGVGASPTPVVRYGRGARHGLRVFVDRAALLPTTSPAPRHSLSSRESSRLFFYPILARIQFLLDSVEETTSNSEVAESSPPNVQPIIPKVLECSTESSSSSASGNSVDRAPSLCIAVVGATGELARNKIFPALFALYYSGFLPEVILSEECGMEAQGRYFGHYGVIRDIVHSHILQTIALFAMEPPVSLDGEDIRNERVEIRIQFHHVPGNLYRERISHNIDLTTNELILRDQPDEAILLKVNNKVPGLGLQLDASELNLLYRDKYDVEVPDSYEHLLLDVIDGDTHLFMRAAVGSCMEHTDPNSRQN